MSAKVWAVLGIEMLIFAALLFVPAGTIDWPAAWAYLIVTLVGGIWFTAYLARRYPAVLAERMKFPIQKGQPLWDKVLIFPLIAVWGGWLVVMGLDAGRYHRGAMPVWLEALGGVVIVVTYGMMLRVFSANTFLAAAVRVQKERGHRVISTGPYAVVRHPLYATMLIYMPANALMLGSWWGVEASLVFWVVLGFRAVMEERELRRNLEGYEEYARKVRYRMVPFVW